MDKAVVVAVGTADAQVARLDRDVVAHFVFDRSCGCQRIGSAIGASWARAQVGQQIGHRDGGEVGRPILYFPSLGSIRD